MTDLILKYSSRPHLRIKKVNKESFPEILLPYFRKSCDGQHLVVTNYFFNENKKIHDVCRYDLRYCHDNWMLFEPNQNKLATLNPWLDELNKNDCLIDKDREANNILVILESPHKDEYCNKCFSPLAPANGVTGINFLAYFASPGVNLILSSLIKLGLSLDESKTYKICFVNPVQFQASLHFIIQAKLDSLSAEIVNLGKGKKSQKKKIQAAITKIKNAKKTIKEEIWKQLFDRCKNDFIRRVHSYSPDIVINACTEKLSDIVKLEIDDPKNNISCRGKFTTFHPSSWPLHLTNNNICSNW